MHLRNRPQWGSVVRPDARFDRLGHSDRVTTSRAAAPGVFAAPDDVVALLGPIITADLERRFHGRARRYELSRAGIAAAMAG